MLTAQCRGTQQAESTTPWWVRCSSSYGSVLALVDSRSRRILGYSAEEYRRIIDATLVLFGVTAFLSVVLELDLAWGTPRDRAAARPYRAAGQPADMARCSGAQTRQG